MNILDWRNPLIACGSLGNIVAFGYASEYLTYTIGADIGVIIPDWHQDIWPLFVPLNRIFYSELQVPNGVKITNCKPVYPYPHSLEIGWFYSALSFTGLCFNVKEKLKPRINWLHNRNSRNILIWPREHHHKNCKYTLEYWVELCQCLINNDWEIVAILDKDVSHRDGIQSVEWCNEFQKHIPCKLILEPTIANIQLGCSMCRTSISIMNGPAWLLLKSTINQVILDMPSSTIEQEAYINVKLVDKPLKLVSNSNFDWVTEL